MNQFFRQVLFPFLILAVFLSPAVAEDPDRYCWAIGIYQGTSPTTLAPAPGAVNPVLTAAQVTDAPAAFVADPFMIRQGSTWFMFFEVFNRDTRQGDIGLATSADGLAWTYERIVLDEPFSLAFPCVFPWAGRVYMIAETWQAGAIRLYEAVDFPIKWQFVSELIQGHYVDPTLFRHNGRWWLFAENGPIANDTLRLFFADKLLGPWTEHRLSPVVKGDENIARPGGRVVVVDGQILRFAQDDTPIYGNQVWGFRVTALTPRRYEEKRLAKRPIITGSGTGWNRLGMHHIDLHRTGKNLWIACVDGFTEAFEPRP
ncbi:MAG: hypothetical protein JEZ11_09130 [Desulfobacterales bacterium]|nr:hypothetical protein [Desulfobacterales bacterium]